MDTKMARTERTEAAAGEWYGSIEAC